MDRHKEEFHHMTSGQMQDLVALVADGKITIDQAIQGFRRDLIRLIKTFGLDTILPEYGDALVNKLNDKINKKLAEMSGQGFRDRRYRGRRYRLPRSYWPQYRYGRIPPWYRPAVDYRDNYWIPPYEIPVEPNYFPGYNIVEARPPYNDYYWPIR